MLTVLSGALAGVVHVLSGPDHLAAVAPLAIADRRRGWLAGGTWGVGHTSGVMTIAVLAVLLRDALPPVEAISAWSERLVGAALIAVGFWALRAGLRIRTAPHTHGRVRHVHVHVGAGRRLTRRLGHAHASFLMGVLHGIAGSSHFLGVLPALALPTTAGALAYIAAFGAGSILAMTGFGAAVGAAPCPHAQRAFMLSAAAMAFMVGSVWLVL
ncbi:MAG: High-affinity nickel transporter [Vicinamibacterales bacterium]